MSAESRSTVQKNVRQNGNKAKQEYKKPAVDQTSEELTPVLKIIQEFASADGVVKYGDEYLIPYELTNKQRSVVHETVKTFGLSSESITLLGSNNKKIKIARPQPNVSYGGSKPEVRLTNEEIEIFANYVGAHFPCTYPEYAEYYVALFDQIFNTREMWGLYLEELKMFPIKKEIADTMRKICETFRENTEYQKLMATQYKGVGDKMKKDVYNISNIGKYFVSIDIRSANFTMLRDYCPTLFTDEEGEIMDWYRFVKQYTKSEFVARSKYFREVCFGNTGFISKAATLQEIFMDGVHRDVMRFSTDNNLGLTPRMKAGDENVYELHDHDLFEKSVNELKQALGKNMEKLHIRVFKVDQIATKNYFLKTFTYNTDWFDSDGKLRDVSTQSLKSKIEFKRVPKYFLPQVIRWFNKEKIQPNDLLFVHEGILAEYKATIFD